MADVQSWQRQNMKKSGAEPAPHEMNAKLACGHGTMNPKIAKPTFASNSVGKTAARPIAHFADGGEVDEAVLKSEGLAASANDKVSLWERIKAGNIDDPKSEAYNRFGAGRARADRDEQSRKDEYAAMNKASAEKEASGQGAWLGASEDAAPAPKTTAADFQRTDKDTSPAPAKTAARKVAQAPAKAPAKAPEKKAEPARAESLSQRLGRDFASIQTRLNNIPAGTSIAARKALEDMAAKARKAYEDAADAEKSGRSVVMKR